jgi:hypothetical protein
MRWHPRTGFILQFSSGDRRIMQKSELIVVTSMELEHVFWILQAQSRTYCFQNFSGSLGTFPIEIRHEFSEAGEYFVRKPNIWLFFVFLASDFIAFLLQISINPTLLD